MASSHSEVFILNKQISSSWKSKVQKGIAAWPRYYALFEQRTPYQESPLDGIHLTTTQPLTTTFLQLAKQLAEYHQHYGNSKCNYNESFTFGCVRVFMKPKYFNNRSIKIIINPSEGGLAMQQVLDWITFITGGLDDVWVRAVHWKMDIHGLNTVKCIQSIWWPHFRKAKLYKGKTLYLGTSKSKRQLVIYNKAAHMKQRGDLTRIELRQKYDKHSEMLIADFTAKLVTVRNPFEDVLLVNASPQLFNQCLSCYNKQIIDGVVYKTLKGLNWYERVKVLQQLASMNLLTQLSPVYDQQLTQWLGGRTP
jgi:hypothetical protein